ncbi:MAG: glycosyltransferase family 92 protein [Desulfovibrio sp.]|nr:glycosyltransferase family 92 protein [Desulfovibrio sp.]MBI4959420.1 glycosyltransferase family 92 protein [Desulfovibrio sp.]
MPQHYFALCAIAKDEDRYLREWIDYHTMIGVERFILFDNESRIPIAETLKDYDLESFITIIPVQGKAAQKPAYNHCLQEFRDVSRWMGFIDLDEFICLNDASDIRALLAEYEEFGGLAASWVTFGSSGHIGRPSGLQIENYTQAFEDFADVNTHVKSFVQPARTLEAVNPHKFKYVEPYHCVNEEFTPVPLSFSYNTRKRLQVNHYPIRSQQDFEEKLARGRADTDVKEYGYAPDAFYAHLKEPTRPERSILRLADRLRTLRQSHAPGRFHEVSNRYPAGMSLQEFADIIVRLVGKGEHEEAEVALCQAGLDHGSNPQYLILRAMVARLGGKLELALTYLRHSLVEVAAPQAYHEMHHVLKQMGKNAEAKMMLPFTQFLIRHHGIEDKNLENVLSQDIDKLG